MAVEYIAWFEELGSGDVARVSGREAGRSGAMR
jgi:hypothetical protein